MKTVAAANFAVVPTQFDIEGGEEVQAYAFNDITVATQFAQELQEFGRKLYGQLSGIGPKRLDKESATDEDKAANTEAKKKLAGVTQGLCLDVLIVPENGDPMRMASLRK